MVISNNARVVIVLIAVPVLLFLALGVALIFIAAKHSTSAVDPVGGMRAILGLALGLATASALLTLVWVCAWNGALRIAVAIIVAAAVFDPIAVPLSHWIASRVDPRASMDETPNQPLQATAASRCSGVCTVAREHQIRC